MLKLFKNIAYKVGKYKHFVDWDKLMINTQALL